MNSIKETVIASFLEIISAHHICHNELSNRRGRNHILRLYDA